MQFLSLSGHDPDYRCWTRRLVKRNLDGALVVAFGCLIMLAAGPQALAQSPKSIPSSNVANEAKDIRDSVSLIGLQKEYIVNGDQLFDGYFLGAETLTFKAGARLIFSDAALGSRNNLLIAARTVIMEDPSKPGTITWIRENGLSQPTSQSGQAGSGPNGVGDGAPGGPGSNGIQGNTGSPGRAGPNLTLFLMAMRGAPPTIDLRGQAGGQAGDGQRGGDGGVGQHGSPASSGAFDCKSGAGYGGAGGAGGRGGRGGTGGVGGRGGTVTFVSLPDAFPSLLQLIRADVNGGEGGPPGGPGSGGRFGPGGSQGAKSLPFCKDEPGRRGPNGLAGEPGEQGSSGPGGGSGDVLYTTITQQNFKAIFGIE